MKAARVVVLGVGLIVGLQATSALAETPDACKARAVDEQAQALNNCRKIKDGKEARTCIDAAAQARKDTEAACPIPPIVICEQGVSKKGDAARRACGSNAKCLKDAQVEESKAFADCRKNDPINVCVVAVTQKFNVATAGCNSKTGQERQNCIAPHLEQKNKAVVACNEDNLVYPKGKPKGH